jgi:hypothetical protein
MVGFTTSLGIGRKLEHIIANPRVALAFHVREHGFSASPRAVLVQGIASVDLQPDRARLEALIPRAERFMGEVKRGPGWDRLLREYYRERVFIDISVRRVVSWPDPAAAGQPEVFGAPLPAAPTVQQPPRKGTGPRVDMTRMAKQVSALPHRALAFSGADGLPVVVPVEFGRHTSAGLALVAPASLLPRGGRRAGLVAHSYHPQLVGLSTRMFTGWLEVSADGGAIYAPHTSKGFMAPPFKDLLLVTNGLFAKYGMWQAGRKGLMERLERLPRIDPAAIP